MELRRPCGGTARRAGKSYPCAGADRFKQETLTSRALPGNLSEARRKPIAQITASDPLVELRKNETESMPQKKALLRRSS